LRDLVLAAMMDAKPAFVGTVEFGIRGGSDLLERLKSLRIPKPAVACSISARWVAPELFCTVRFCGWRRGGVWRDGDDFQSAFLVMITCLEKVNSVASD
jgi:hypothetical protein